MVACHYCNKNAEKYIDKCFYGICEDCFKKGDPTKTNEAIRFLYRMTHYAIATQGTGKALDDKLVKETLAFLKENGKDILNESLSIIDLFEILGV